MDTASDRLTFITAVAVHAEIEELMPQFKRRHGIEVDVNYDVNPAVAKITGWSIEELVGKTPEERRAVIHTIGPVWDGNEVWLLTAGGATFAAFPNWYASMFSGFYLALFLVLFGLIIRGVSFEFWGKVESPHWRSVWRTLRTRSS